VVVPFAGTAQASPRFRDPAKAMAWIDSHVRAGGTTAYLAALRQGDLKKGRVGIFASDGEPDEPARLVLDYLRRNVHCPLHTIAMKPEAADVLAKMAAQTGGGAHTAHDSEKLVRALLAIVQDIRGYRITEPKTSTVSLAGVRGTVLAIGFDSEVAIGGVREVVRHSRAHARRARLPLPRQRHSSISCQGKDIERTGYSSSVTAERLAHRLP